MNRINKLFEERKGKVCSIFVTAGYPDLNSTVSTVLDLEIAGVDLIELGMPFSDPLADGETIQRSSDVALANGMHLDLLFSQIEEIRKKSEIPIVLMGYANPVFNYGVDKFLTRCKEVGVDGLIIPDISLEEYELNFRELFEASQVPMTFLITPRTAEERINRIDKLTNTFIYFVSSASTTGKAGRFDHEQMADFEKIRQMNLASPVLMGFGIHDYNTFQIACDYFNGGIIGSAFIRALERNIPTSEFVGSLKGL